MNGNVATGLGIAQKVQGRNTRVCAFAQGIVQNDLNDFDISNVKLMFIFMLAGPMTVIPLYLYVRGVELCGLGPTGMVFYITPTLQFLLGYFLYNEELDIHKLISFILIWIAVSIYLKDLYEKN